MVDSSENSEKVDAFEKKEWRLADMKHYGKLVDFTKKTQVCRQNKFH
jgi:hypothetical protein